jgi:putative transposase
MSLKRTRGAVYDLKYHFVWVPKYRRMVLEERVTHRLWDIFLEIAECYGYDSAMQEVMRNHVPIFLSVSLPL